MSVENRKELCHLGKFIHLACKARNNLVWLTCMFIIIIHNFLTYLVYFLICHTHIYIYMLYNHVIITCHIVYWWTVMFKLIKNLNLNLFILIVNSALKQIWFGFLILTLVWIQCIVVWKLRYILLKVNYIWLWIACKLKS